MSNGRPPLKSFEKPENNIKLKEIRTVFKLQPIDALAADLAKFRPPYLKIFRDDLSIFIEKVLDNYLSFHLNHHSSNSDKWFKSYKLKTVIGTMK